MLIKRITVHCRTHLSKNFIYRFIVQFLCMYETCIRNFFFIFLIEMDLVKHAFFILHICCILVCMLIWKVIGVGNVGIGKALVPTFVKEPLHLGVGSSVCSFWKQLTCFFVSNKFKRLAVLLLDHVMWMW